MTMTDDGLSTTILSDVDFEQLVAEVSIGDQFLCLLDRDRVRENLRISFPLADGKLGAMAPLTDFIAHLQAAADSFSR